MLLLVPWDFTNLEVLGIRTYLKKWYYCLLKNAYDLRRYRSICQESTKQSRIVQCKKIHMHVYTCKLLASADLFKYIYYQQAFVLIISQYLNKGSTGTLVQRWDNPAMTWVICWYYQYKLWYSKTFSSHLHTDIWKNLL